MQLLLVVLLFLMMLPFFVIYFFFMVLVKASVIAVYVHAIVISMPMLLNHCESTLFELRYIFKQLVLRAEKYNNVSRACFRNYRLHANRVMSEMVHSYL